MSMFLLYWIHQVFEDNPWKKLALRIYKYIIFTHLHTILRGHPSPSVGVCFEVPPLFQHEGTICTELNLTGLWWCQQADSEIQNYELEIVEKTVWSTCNVGLYSTGHHHNYRTLFDQMCQSSTTSYQCLANSILGYY